MTWGLVAVAGATLVGGVLSSNAMKGAAGTAASAQDRAAQLGMDQQQRQFDIGRTDLLRLLQEGQFNQLSQSAAGRGDLLNLLGGGNVQQQQMIGKGVDEQHQQLSQIQKLMQPYLQAGGNALGGQMDLAGLGAPGAQQAAIKQIMAGPEYQALSQQGADTILQNASATGGLRGGNVQGALAQFQPSLLSSLINQQYGRLAGLGAQGQSAAGFLGGAGLQTGQGIAQLLSQGGNALLGANTSAGQSLLGAGVTGGSNALGANVNAGSSILNGGNVSSSTIAQLLQQQGAAQAGGALAGGRATAGMINNGIGALGTFVGSGGWGNLFGGSSGAGPGPINNVLF